MKLELFVFSIFLAFSCAQRSDSCGVGKFLNSGGECQLCPPGEYQDKFFPSVSSCTPCPEGSFFPISGAQSKQACIPCPANTFASAAGSTSCKPCPSGQVTGIGYSRCDKCKPGQFVNSDIGVSARSPQPVCRDCFFRTSLVENSFVCDAERPSVNTDCPPGTEVGQPGTCAPCLSGQFNDGSTARCQQCPRGSISGERASKCTPCPKNTFQNRDDIRRANECNPCPTGRSTNGTGNYFCRKNGGQCPENWWINNNGDCRTCLQRQRYNPAGDTCEPCPEGLFSDGGIDQKCRPCNELSPVSRDRSFCMRPRVCQGGSELRNGTCRGCNPNTASTFGRNRGRCEPCEKNEYALSTSQSRCLKCPECTTRAVNERFCTLIDDISKCKPSLTGCQDFFVYRPGSDGVGICECPAVITREMSEIASTCIECIPLSFGPGGQSNRFNLEAKRCERCSVFQSTDGFSACQSCPDDSVNIGEGVCGCRGNQAQDRGVVNGKCKKCEPGSVGIVSGNDMNNICAKCPAGTFANPRRPPVPVCMSRFCPGPQPLCTLCEEGFFSGEGATACTECPSGTTTFGRGGTRCVPF